MAAEGAISKGLIIIVRVSMNKGAIAPGSSVCLFRIRQESKKKNENKHFGLKGSF